MDRRGLVRRILALFAVVVVVVGFAASSTATAAAPTSHEEPPPPTSVETDAGADRPVPTVSEFYPEDANLSDCLGLVQRPGCGSEARGGWRQTAVFGMILVGMGLIAWRVSVGIRKNRASMTHDASTPDTDDS